MTLSSTFVRRLKIIGVSVELRANYPWIYLYSVNGKVIKNNFHANHGFTAFFTPVTLNGKMRWSDRRKVFEKVREVLNDD